MRKLIILGLLAATVAPSVASAQSYGEARRSERQLREEKRDLRQAQRYGDRGDVREPLSPPRVQTAEPQPSRRLRDAEAPRGRFCRLVVFVVSEKRSGVVARAVRR